MFTNNKVVKILLGLFGCLCIAIFFVMQTYSKTSILLRQNISKNEILQKAEDVFQNSELADYDLRRSIDLDLDNTLSKYAQLYLNNERPGGFYPIGSWSVEWTGTTQTKKEGEIKVHFRVKYDFDGNLIERLESAPHLRRPYNFKNSEAAEEAARRFLHTVNIDTSAITVRNSASSKDDRVLIYDFSFSKPSSISTDLRESYEVNIAGRRITNYSARLIVDSDKVIFPKIHQTSKTVSIIIAIAIWFIIGLFLIGVFIKRLRHDELEFKRACWLGLTGFIIMWLAMAIEFFPQWAGMVLAGGLIGLFTGLGLILVYSVTDSLNRDVWREKEVLPDIIVRGFLRVKEMGAAILDSLFVSGLTLLTFGLLFWLNGQLNLGFIDFDADDHFWIFQGNLALLKNIFHTLIGSLYIGLVLLSFWFAYLKSKVRSNKILIILFAVLINLAGLHLYQIRPTYMAFFLLLPLACFWSYYAFKSNFISIFLSLFTVNFFLKLSLIGNLPNGFFSIPMIFSATFILILFASGTYLIHSKATAKDFEHYVPEYVGRIAERERFLKELEIARTVQLRFLPQSIPEFPHLDIACVCKPAMEVGGDYYDFMPNGNDSLGIVIGDVSGKGVSAAFYMTMAKGIIKTLSKSTSNPKEILTRMNEIFYENAPKDVFISVIYGLFDKENSQLVFARAGHNPVIVCKKMAKKPEFLKPNGLAIGLEKGPLFSQTIEEATIPMEKDDIFVFFTDGVSEAMNKNGDEFGEERLQQIISQNGQCSADDLVNKIAWEVKKFMGKAKQHDDITMVVVKVAG